MLKANRSFIKTKRKRKEIARAKMLKSDDKTARERERQKV